jgi:hypothetical protein
MTCPEFMLALPACCASWAMGPALYHAEKALERCPDDVTLRLMGASLALAQMKWTRAEELAA